MTFNVFVLLTVFTLLLFPYIISLVIIFEMLILTQIEHLGDLVLGAFIDEEVEEGEEVEEEFYMS